jgi:predicted porin
MKKHLIAAAVAAAVAVPAMAQVTVYGGIGGSYTDSDTGGLTTITRAGSSGTDHWKTTALGVRGSEDLGGGMTAFFQLEGDLDSLGALGGTSSSAATSNFNNIFNRQAHVGISGSFGTITAGRQNDALKDIYGIGQYSNLSDNIAFAANVGARIANAYKYTSPTFQGFKAAVAYSRKAVDANGATGAGSGSGISSNTFSLSGKIGNVDVALGYGVSDGGGSDGDLTTTIIGAKTTIAGLGVAGSYTMNNREGGDLDLDQILVSVKYSVGAVDVLGHIWNNNTNGTGDYAIASGSASGSSAGAVRGDGSGLGLLVAYNLSKRTGLYAGYSNFNASGTGAAARDNTTSTVGVFHSF